MNQVDVGYTNGVIAVREKYLLKDKLARLCELNAEDSFRALLDSNFGGGAETTTNVYEFEKLIEVEEERVDEFINTYAPSFTEKAYLLVERDFHNAKAFVKSRYLNVDASRMLCSDGLIKKEELRSIIEKGSVAELRQKNSFLASAIEECLALEEKVSGIKIGEIFERATYGYLFELIKHKPMLKKLLTAKADMTNILIAFRCEREEQVKEKWLPFGSLKIAQLTLLLSGDWEKIKGEFTQTPYLEFVKQCVSAKEKGLPQTDAENIRDSYDTAFFEKRKYELQKAEPFLYYVYRRRAENNNVRILYVCLLAGMTDIEIKKRLRIW